MRYYVQRHLHALDTQLIFHRRIRLKGSIRLLHAQKETNTERDFRDRELCSFTSAKTKKGLQWHLRQYVFWHKTSNLTYGSTPTIWREKSVWALWVWETDQKYLTGQLALRDYTLHFTATLPNALIHTFYRFQVTHATPSEFGQVLLPVVTEAPAKQLPGASQWGRAPLTTLFTLSPWPCIFLTGPTAVKDLMGPACQSPSPSL